MIAGFLNHQSYFNKENFLASLRFSGSPTNLYDLRRILNLLRSHTVNGPGSQGSTLLLMVQKSGDHQLRLVIFPIIYGVYTPSKRWLLGIFSINRIFLKGTCHRFTIFTWWAATPKEPHMPDRQKGIGMILGGGMPQHLKLEIATWTSSKWEKWGTLFDIKNSQKTLLYCSKDLLHKSSHEF